MPLFGTVTLSPSKPPCWWACQAVATVAPDCPRYDVILGVAGATHTAAASGVAWVRSPPALIAPEALAQATRPPLIVQVTEAAYFASHVPGAVLVEPRELVSGVPPAVGELPDVGRLSALFGRIGYRPELEIVVLDDEGGGWAGRFAWMLDVIGHRNWRYLNGGLHAWRAAGLPLETAACRPAWTTPRIRIQQEPMADAEELLRRRDDSHLLIWDCRSGAEYRGERVTAARNGHIPGAINLDWLALMDVRRDLRLVDDLATRLASHGIDRNRDVVVHCQTHHRSGLAYMVGRLLGFERIRAYAGSWSEWGNRPDTPVATGG